MINKMDDLALAEMSELEALQARYRDGIRHARRNGEDTTPYEVELNYVQRELHVREQRERFVEKMNRASFHHENRV
jgi:hypothetical protein